MTSFEQAHPDYSWAGPSLREHLQTNPKGALADRGLNVPDDLPKHILDEFIRMTHLLWVDGIILPIDRFHIDPADEGLLFGRGLWESTKTIDGIPWLWDYHLERLFESAKIVGINIARERIPDAETVREFVRFIGTQDVVIRVNVTAGRPGKEGLVWMSAWPMPMPRESLRLKIIKNPVLGGEGFLILKTFQYATRMAIGQMARDTGYDSALLLDENDNITESSHANIFFKTSAGWVTPVSNGTILPGTVRRLLVERSPFPMRQEVVPVSILSDVKECFVSNSNLGIVPVTQIDQFSYVIGNETRELVKWIEPPPSDVPQFRLKPMA